MDKHVCRNVDAIPKRRRKDLQESFGLQIEKMCQQLLPSSRPSDHVHAFLEKINDLKRPVKLQGYNSYESYFVGYAMIHLYEKNVTDIPTVTKALDLFSGYFSVRARFSLKPEEREILYTEWNAKFFMKMVANAVLTSQYGVISFLAKYGKCSFAVPYNELEFMLFYFTRAMFRNPLDESQIRKLARNVDMSFSRLVLTMLSIEAAFYCSEASTPAKLEICKRRARCIDLLARTTTEPPIAFVDIEEVARFANYSPTNRRSLRQHSLQQASVIELRWQHLRPIPEKVRPHLLKLFPDMSDYRHVRLLSDLSRSKVRDSLRSDHALTQQVSALPLPNILKNFILFHESDFAESMWDDVTMKFIWY